MGALGDEIQGKVQDFMDGDYEIEEVTDIPTVDQVQFGKKAKKIKVCVFYFDLRDSTKLLNQKQKQTVAKVHKSFMYAVARAVTKHGGQIRSFNGDSVLAFWPANYKSEINNAVRAAMAVKYLLDVKCKSDFDKYWPLDFGIGLDWSEMLVVRTGVPRVSTNNDLVFIGRAVNLSVVMSDASKGPKHIQVSDAVHCNLDDDLKQYTNSYGGKSDCWEQSGVVYAGSYYTTYKTSCYVEV